MPVNRKKVAEGGCETAPQVSDDEREEKISRLLDAVVAAADPPPTKASEKMVARVKLIIGKTSFSHGRDWVHGRSVVVMDENLVSKLKQDGNFSVEMLPSSVALKKKTKKAK